MEIPQPNEFHTQETKSKIRSCHNKGTNCSTAWVPNMKTLQKKKFWIFYAEYLYKQLILLYIIQVYFNIVANSSCCLLLLSKPPSLCSSFTQINFHFNITALQVIDMSSISFSKYLPSFLLICNLCFPLIPLISFSSLLPFHLSHVALWSHFICASFHAWVSPPNATFLWHSKHSPIVPVSDLFRVSSARAAKVL